MRAEETRPVLLFDGVCSLCNGFVRFVIPRDPSARLLFAPLQSAAGRELLVRFGLPADNLESLVLVEGESCTTRSEAALRVLASLGGPWKALRVLLVVPRPLRDAVYDFVARHRYRIFGKEESCMIPTPEINARFLD